MTTAHLADTGTSGPTPAGEERGFSGKALQVFVARFVDRRSGQVTARTKARTRRSTATGRAAVDVSERRSHDRGCLSELQSALRVTV